MKKNKGKKKTDKKKPGNEGAKKGAPGSSSPAKCEVVIMDKNDSDEDSLDLDNDE